MKVLLLNGSPNKDGNTYYMLCETQKILDNLGADTEIINIAEAVLSAKTPFCNVCSNPCNKSCYKGTKLEEVYDKMSDADALIFGSPVYFGGITAQLKAFFDKSRAYRGKKAFVAIPAGVITVGASKYGGQESTAKNLHDMLMVQGMTVFNDGWCFGDAGHHGALAQRPAEKDENAKVRIEIFANRAFYEAKRNMLMKTL